MRYFKELSNRNRIVSEQTCNAVVNLQDTSCYVIKFVISGSEKCIVNSRAMSIFPDSFTVINAGTDYCSLIDSISPVHTLTLYLDTKFVEDFNRCFSLDHEDLLAHTESKDKPRFMETLYPLVGNLNYNIAHLKKQIDNGIEDEMLLNEYLHHCLIGYYQIYTQEIDNKYQRLSFLKTKTKKEIFRRLLLAKEYLHSNSDKEVKLEDLAKYCCLSTNHLLRTFKEAFGKSPWQYLIQLRLDRAKSFLRTTDYPLSEIICLVGFESLSSFVRLFKTSVGITPFKYKKLNAAKNNFFELRY